MEGSPVSRLAALLKADLGALGLLSLLVLALTVAFSIAYVRPLEARKAQLEREADTRQRRAGGDFIRVASRNPSHQMDDFYRFFERGQRTDEWLAKLYGIGTAAGLQLRAGTYRLDETRQRFDRYQVQLPVRGSYAQIRAFLEASLAEIPVMSLDQVSFRRKAANETAVEAEIVLTLHLLRR
jgi:Tfp pilus assembly protein PilO